MNDKVKRKTERMIKGRFKKENKNTKKYDRIKISSHRVGFPFSVILTERRSWSLDDCRGKKKVH